LLVRLRVTVNQPLATCRFTCDNPANMCSIALSCQSWRLSEKETQHPTLTRRVSERNVPESIQHTMQATQVCLKMPRTMKTYSNLSAHTIQHYVGPSGRAARGARRAARGAREGGTRNAARGAREGGAERAISICAFLFVGQHCGSKVGSSTSNVNTTS
jgi:hypothetical protein